jgi:hypothetical protein
MWPLPLSPRSLRSPARSRRYHYPASRTAEHKKDKAPVGVTGSVELLNSRVISTQPIVSFDWSPDKEGLCCLTCLDQTLRVFIVTKLNKY